MMNFLKTIMETWFVGRNLQLARENNVMDYFRSEYKHDAEWAYEYWRSTGKMNWSM